MLPAKTYGPAADLLRRMKALPAMRRARIDVRGRGEVTHLLVGIAQVHPVSQGTFRRGQARAIGGIQAWIERLCAALRDVLGVRVFGQEGFSAPEGGSAFRLQEELLEECRRGIRIAGGPQQFLRGIAADWRGALRRGDAREVERTSALLNALTVLQAEDPDVAVFPIEQRDVHGAVGEGIDRLHAEIERAEADPAYRRAQAKQGRGLAPDEYHAAVRRSDLVKAFNATLAHPERDRAIFREVAERAERTEVTVFVLGTAHRRGMLKVARQFLPEGVLFAWVTPPQLWWARAMVRRVLWACGIILLLLAVSRLF